MPSLGNKSLHLSRITKKMGAIKSFTVLPILLFLLYLFVPFQTYAQLGTIYFSAGYNNVWYGKSNIHLEQGELGNSYTMLKVKGDSKTGAAISPLMLNYRLGFYFGEFQTVGMEISYDPFNYAIKDNQVVTEKGTVNGKLNVTKPVLFSKGAGSYYYFSGVNFINVNFVRRYHVFNNNTKSLQLDIVGKVGVGPAMPHFQSSLPVNPVDGPQFAQGGWNTGAEIGLKATVYRFVYLEITGKYDYANFNNLKIYNGTANQELHTYGVIASVGATLPTMKLNPLFHKEHRITTILPFYQHIDQLTKTPRKKKLKKGDGTTGDSLSVNGMEDIPEFDEIVEKKYRKEHPITYNTIPDDSISKYMFLELDSTGKIIGPDSMINRDSVFELPKAPVHLSKRELKKQKKEERRARKEQARKEKEGLLPNGTESKTDSSKAPEVTTPAVNDTGALVPAEPGTKPEEPKAPEHLSKKERKRKEKEAREAKAEEERKAKEAQKEAPKTEETKAPEVTAPETNVPEPKTEEVKPEAPKAPEMSKKERKRKEKEEREAKKEEERKAREEEKRKAAELKEQEKKAEETKAPEVAAPEIKPPEQKTEEVKPEEPKAPEMSKKERKRMEKEARKAKKQKEKEAKDAPENTDNKNKTDEAPQPKP